MEKTMSTCILIIDDDPEWRGLLSVALHKAGYEVTLASTGTEALAHIQTTNFDLIILDVHLPDCDGKDLCSTVRQQQTNVPVIMISGIKKEDMDHEFALNSGADCYLKKPVSVRVVAAQVHALLRRIGVTEKNKAEKHEGGWLEVDNYLRIHLGRRLVMAGGHKVNLTPQEFKLLACLSRRPGQVIPAHQLRQAVWQDSSAADQSEDYRLKNTIKRLRQKIEPDPKRPRYVFTLRGEGYYLDFKPKPIEH
jgi:DNA-binding response OmpR family regulator